MSDETAVNWRELPAGRELDRLIAERLGRYVNSNATDWWYDDAGFIGRIPAFSTDLNAAVTLLAGCNRSWKLSYDFSYGFDGRTGYSISIDGTVYCQFIDTPAFALCMAFLAWRESEIRG